MAKIVENDKNLKIIQMDTEELISITDMPFAVCDSCNNQIESGYYIAVLNQYFCEECYKEWYKRAVNYPEDRHIEDRNFNFYKNELEVRKFLG